MAKSFLKIVVAYFSIVKKKKNPLFWSSQKQKSKKKNYVLELSQKI